MRVNPIIIVASIVFLVIITILLAIIMSQQQQPIKYNDKCCWNNPLLTCSVNGDCDANGEGCMKNGTLDNSAAVITCDTCKSRGLTYNAVTKRCESTGKCCANDTKIGCNVDSDCGVSNPSGPNGCVASHTNGIICTN